MLSVIFLMINLSGGLSAGVTDPVEYTRRVIQFEISGDIVGMIEFQRAVFPERFNEQIKKYDSLEEFVEKAKEYYRAQPPYKNNEFCVTSDLLEALQYQPALARLKGKELKDGYTIVFSGDGVNRAAYTLWEEVESGWQNIKFSLDAFELDIDNPN